MSRKYDLKSTNRPRPVGPPYLMASVPKNIRVGFLRATDDGATAFAPVYGAYERLSGGVVVDLKTRAVKSFPIPASDARFGHEVEFTYHPTSHMGTWIWRDTWNSVETVSMTLGR